MVGRIICCCARFTRRPLAFYLDRGAAIALALSLLAFLPVLAIDGIETEYRWLTLCLIAAMGLIVGLAVQEFQRPINGGVQAPASRRVWIGLVATSVLTVGYVAFMSWLTVARHQSFLTHAFDLGIQDQSLFTLLRRGYPITTLYEAVPFNQFGDHFAPIYYLLAPVYALFRDARALLVVQSLFLGLGALPVYLLTWKKTRSAALAFALAASYLLFPALHGVNAFDFHEIALATALLLWSLYGLETERPGLFVVFLVLALMTKEEAALSVAAIGLYAALCKRRPLLGAGVVVGSLVYFLAVTLLVMPALGGGPDVGRFGELAGPGATGFTAILQGILANPIYAFSYAFLNGDKLFFLALLLLPVAFTPLRARGEWITAVPALAVALLAQVPSQYSIDYHYPAIMIPFVFFLAAAGLHRVGWRRVTPVALAASILTLSLVMNWQYGWLLGKRFPGAPTLTTHARILHNFVDEIPDRASVSTMSDVAPHLSARDAIYLFPIVADAEYILFDSDLAANFWPYEGMRARADSIDSLLPYLTNGGYGLVRQEDGVMLLQKGYSTAGNDEALRAVLSARYEAESLPGDLDAPDLPDPTASAGVARRADARPRTRGWEASAGLRPVRSRASWRLSGGVCDEGRG